MGSEAPNELREPLRSFIDGDKLRLCMYAEASDTALRVAGTSMAPPCSSLGMGNATPLVEALRFVSSDADMMERYGGYSKWQVAGSEKEEVLKLE
jgi:hypothetical protein